MKRRKRPTRLTLIKPNPIDSNVWQALTAARAGRRQQLAKLIAEDPRTRHEKYWYTKPLYFAVREGHLPVVQMLFLY